MNGVRTAATTALVLLLALTGHGESSFARADLVWADAQTLNTNAAGDEDSDYYLHWTHDGAGNWVCVWCAAVPGASNRDFDILVTHSSDNGLTWSTPSLLDPYAVDPPEIEDDFHPVIATDGAGHWVAIWYTHDDHGGTLGTDTDLLISRSTDNGATWTSSVPFNDDAATDLTNDSTPTLVTDGNGLWVAVWQKKLNPATEDDDYDLYISRSTDHGVTWTPMALLNPYFETEIDWDSSPSLATDQAGHWVVTWTSNTTLDGTIDIDDDLLVSRSSDGINWTAPTALNSHAAGDTLDDNASSVSTNGVGRWLAVWYYGVYEVDYDIMFSYSDDQGATWSPAEFLNTNALTDSGRDVSPRVSADDQGNWVAVWQSKEPIIPMVGTDYDILYAYSTDNGQHWSPPWFLNSYAWEIMDFDWDRNPEILYAGDRTWRTAWAAKFDLGGAIGTDYDLMISSATLVPDADHNADSAVDLYDFAGLQDCFAPNGPVGIGCTCYDLDSDQDVDWDDFEALFARLNGPAF